VTSPEALRVRYPHWDYGGRASGAQHRQWRAILRGDPPGPSSGGWEGAQETSTQICCSAPFLAPIMSARRDCRRRGKDAGRARAPFECGCVLDRDVAAAKVVHFRAFGFWPRDFWPRDFWPEISGPRFLARDFWPVGAVGRQASGLPPSLTQKLSPSGDGSSQRHGESDEVSNAPSPHPVGSGWNCLTRHSRPRCQTVLRTAGPPIGWRNVRHRAWFLEAHAALDARVARTCDPRVGHRERRGRT